MFITALLAGGAAVVLGGVAVQRSPVLAGEIRAGFPAVRKRQASLLDQIKSTAVELDDQYQRFMVERVDPLFGGTRNAALKEIVSVEETLDISDYERQLNRYLAAAGATLGTAIIGAFYPPVLIVTLATALYSTTLIFRNGYEAIVIERRLRMDVIGSLYFIGAYAVAFLWRAVLVSSPSLSEKLVMITQDPLAEESDQRLLAAAAHSLVACGGQRSRSVLRVPAERRYCDIARRAGGPHRRRDRGGQCHD